MKLRHGHHLAYCTNIHRGNSWEETFQALEQHTLRVKERVAPSEPYAIGLRLGDTASRELMAPGELDRFRGWLEDRGCYVFTINGFPYGAFHGTRVKEDVYRPDWTTDERLDYTKRLFEILSRLVPEGIAGSVSTVPASYKEFIREESQVATMRERLWAAVDYIAELSERSGRELHLGLEPEPLCSLETSEEMVAFIEAMRRDRPGDDRINRFLGVNYDTCHLAVEYEGPREVVRRFRDHGVRISKIHLSSALKVTPNPEARAALASFVDDVYFHQVVARDRSGTLTRLKDLDVALRMSEAEQERFDEWRIHFHIPLHSEPTELYGHTADHISGLMDELAIEPQCCQHYEMETYTWEVLPDSMKNRDVVDQLEAEYRWTLDAMGQRGLGR